jgi:hypothetical protein
MNNAGLSKEKIYVDKMTKPSSFADQDVSKSKHRSPVGPEKDKLVIWWASKMEWITIVNWWMADWATCSLVETPSGPKKIDWSFGGLPKWSGLRL